MPKSIKESITYNHKDIMDFLVEFSGFKDRVMKKFKDVSRELENKPNEHELWVNLYLISTDYYEELTGKKSKHDSVMQKIS